jgi:hypothetical protein
MNFVRSISLFVPLLALAGCALDAEAPAEGEEPLAEVQQAVDPSSAHGPEGAAGPAGRQLLRTVPTIHRQSVATLKAANREPVNSIDGGISPASEPPVSCPTCPPKLPSECPTCPPKLP